MSEHPPYHAMAQQFLDFWQDQTKRAMQDERFLNAMMDMMNASATQSSTSSPFATPTYQAGFHAPHSATTATSSSPFQSAPTPTHASGIELAELLRRIERLEARMASTEDAIRNLVLTKHEQLHGTTSTTDDTSSVSAPAMHT